MKETQANSSQWKTVGFVGIGAVLLFAAYGIWQAFQPTPLAEIRDMFNEFEERRGTGRSFDESGIPADIDDLEAYRYTYAVFTNDESNRDNPYGISLVASNSCTFEDSITNEKTRNGMKNLIYHLRRSGIPFDLKDYPISIRIPSHRLKDLQTDTDCKTFLLFPCIENEWPDERKIPSQGESHLTVGILGAEPDDATRINRLHYDKVYGEETWPYADFVWFKDH